MKILLNFYQFYYIIGQKSRNFTRIFCTLYPTKFTDEKLPKTILFENGTKGPHPAAAGH